MQRHYNESFCKKNYELLIVVDSFAKKKKIHICFAIELHSWLVPQLGFELRQSMAESKLLNTTLMSSLKQG